MIPKMFKDRQGISHKIKHMGSILQTSTGAHQSILVAQRLSENKKMDITGTRMQHATNIVAKLTDSTESPLKLLN